MMSMIEFAVAPSSGELADSPRHPDVVLFRVPKVHASTLDRRGFFGRPLAVFAVCTMAAIVAAPVCAQEKTDTKTTDELQLQEVVVTGSLIRGVAPVGSPIISLDEEDIQKTGAVSINQILATLPVVSNAFNTTAANPPGSGSSIYRPIIRNLGAAGGNTTLVLIDGHNAVGAGILQTTPDSGVIPPEMLERVEIVADGGSSIYGADAVGGIVNFITKKKQDGIVVSGHYGLGAGSYNQSDMNITAGTSWSNGSILVSGTVRQNDHLPAGSLDFPRENLTPFGGTDYRVRTCSPGNVTANGTSYALPGLTPGQNLCDSGLLGDVAPQERQRAFFSTLSQDFTDKISLEVKGYLSDRVTTTGQAQLTSSGLNIDNTNPFFRPIGTETSQSFDFSYASVRPAAINGVTELIERGITPVLTFKLGQSWQLKAMYNYGWSETTVHTPGINSSALAAAAAGTTTTTALDPYDLSQTNPAVIDSILDFENFAHSVQTLKDFRVIADGSLWTWAGGDARLAVGGEYQHQTSDALSVNNLVGVLTGAATTAAVRNLKSVFAELRVPLVGSGNEMTLVKSLTLDVSGRRDDYSDFGNTFNPKFGFTWEPVAGLTARGNFGKAFNAPSLADTTGAVDTRAQIIPVSPFRPASSPFDPDFSRPTIILAGGNPNLKPQTADTWSLGLEFAPPQVSGFHTGVTYWNVKLIDTISVVPAGFPATLFTVPAYANLSVINPTLAQAQAATAGMFIDGATSIAALYAGPTTPYLLVDLRRKNLGTMFVSGLDFNVSYTHPIQSGSVFASVSGTDALTRNVLPYAGAPHNDLLTADIGKLQTSFAVGATIGPVTGSATMQYSAGYPVTNGGSRSDIGSFHPINLALQYEFSGNRALSDLSATLNVYNVLDSNPPFLDISGGIGNGSTTGRLVNLGLRKKF